MATQAFFTRLGIAGLPAGVFYTADLSRSQTSHAAGSGAWYFEVTVNAAINIQKIGVGIDDNTESLTLEAGRQGSVCWLGDGTVNYNGYNAIYSASPFSVGDVLGVNPDLTAKTIRFRRNGNPFSAAFPITSIVGGHMVALAQVVSIGDQVTANFTGTSPPFVFSAPATAWG